MDLRRQCVAGRLPQLLCVMSLSCDVASLEFDAEGFMESVSLSWKRNQIEGHGLAFC